MKRGNFKKKELLGPGSSLVVESEAGTKPQELLRFLSLEVGEWYSVWPFGYTFLVSHLGKCGLVGS